MVKPELQLTDAAAKGNTTKYELQKARLAHASRARGYESMSEATPMPYLGLPPPFSILGAAQESESGQACVLVGSVTTAGAQFGSSLSRRC